MDQCWFWLWPSLPGTRWFKPARLKFNVSRDPPLKNQTAGNAACGPRRNEAENIYQLWLLDFLARWTGEDRKLRLVYAGPNKGLADLGRLLEEGKLKPWVDRRFSLVQVPEALRYFGQGGFCGKIAITVSGPQA